MNKILGVSDNLVDENGLQYGGDTSDVSINVLDRIDMSLCVVAHRIRAVI